MTRDTSSEIDKPGGISNILKGLKQKMVDPKLYDTFADWGEAAEDAMRELAIIVFNFDTYDVIFSEYMGTAQLIDRLDDHWMPCKKLTITHSYFDANDNEMGTYERHCFFGHSEDGRIVRFLTEEQVENYTVV